VNQENLVNMTEQVNVQDAKTRLSELLARVERGEEITIARAGKPSEAASRHPCALVDIQ
jgi:hypothetical protein